MSRSVRAWTGCGNWLGQGVELQGEEEQDHWDAVREFDWVPADWSLMKVPMTTSRIADLEENLKSIPYRTRYCAGGSLAWLAWSGPLDPLDSDVGPSRVSPAS